MCNFKDIIKNYNVSNITSKELLEAICSLYPALDIVQDTKPVLFWDTMRNFHEHLKGPHFDEAYAIYQVSNMYHTNTDGIECKGEVFTKEYANRIYESYVRSVNNSYTCWDVYVAINAQYHDYYRMYNEWYGNTSHEEIEHKIIKSAINFWFKDEDAGEGKVWNYFKCIK